MKPSLTLLLGGLTIALFSLGAAAQPGPGMQGMGGMGSMGGMSAGANCGKARDPQRCEALQKAKDSCKDKAGQEKRQCITDAMPPVDCSKSHSPERCEARQKAKEACKDKTGPEHRQCMRDQMPKANSGRMAAPKA